MTKAVIRDKEGYFIIAKGSLHQKKNIHIINIYVPINRAPKYIRPNLTDLKRKTKVGFLKRSTKLTKTLAKLTKKNEEIITREECL